MPPIPLCSRCARDGRERIARVTASWWCGWCSIVMLRSQIFDRPCQVAARQRAQAVTPTPPIHRTGCAHVVPGISPKPSRHSRPPCRFAMLANRAFETPACPAVPALIQPGSSFFAADASPAASAQSSLTSAWGRAPASDHSRQHFQQRAHMCQLGVRPHDRLLSCLSDAAATRHRQSS